MVNFDQALKGLEEIRKTHLEGKEIFLNQLKTCQTIDDLKWIMENHIKVFFDVMNFDLHMTKQSLQLIRDINETGEIDEGKVEQTMNTVIDTIQKYEKEKSQQKENK